MTEHLIANSADEAAELVAEIEAAGLRVAKVLNVGPYHHRVWLILIKAAS